MLLAAVDYYRPDTLAEAVEALDSTEGARPLAGGQSLISILKLRAASVDLLVDISRLEDLRAIAVADDGSVRIGAGVTYDEMAMSPDLHRSHPRLSQVAAHTVDAQVRNRGTFGGNLCHNDHTPDRRTVDLLQRNDVRILPLEYCDDRIEVYACIVAALQHLMKSHAATMSGVQANNPYAVHGRGRLNVVDRQGRNMCRGQSRRRCARDDDGQYGRGSNSMHCSSFERHHFGTTFRAFCDSRYSLSR